MTAASAESWPAPSQPPFADASPAQVRAALTAEDAVEFDREWRLAMSRATEALDLSEVLATLDSWRRIAWLTTAQGPDGYRRMLGRAQDVLSAGRVSAESVSWQELKAELGL